MRVLQRLQWVRSLVLLEPVVTDSETSKGIWLIAQNCEVVVKVSSFHSFMTFLLFVKLFCNPASILNNLYYQCQLIAHLGHVDGNTFQTFVSLSVLTVGLSLVHHSVCLSLRAQSLPPITQWVQHRASTSNEWCQPGWRGHMGDPYSSVIRLFMKYLPKVKRGGEVADIRNGESSKRQSNKPKMKLETKPIGNYVWTGNLPHWIEIGLCCQHWWGAGTFWKTQGINIMPARSMNMHQNRETLPSFAFSTTNQCTGRRVNSKFEEFSKLKTVLYFDLECSIVVQGMSNA